MTLPTSGFTTNVINYTVGVEGSVGLTFTVELRRESLETDTAMENFQAAVESGLQSLADDLNQVSGVTDVKIYRHYQGSIDPATDIRDGI